MPVVIDLVCIEPQRWHVKDWHALVIAAVPCLGTKRYDLREA
jgi:hypothetical protein